VFVNTFADPVNPWVILDGVVGRIDKNNFKPLVGRVLANPVGVQNAKVGSFSGSFFFSNRTKVSGGLQRIDTLVGWFSINNSFWVLLLSVSAANSRTKDHVTLFGSVTNGTSFGDVGRM